jgi:hypothetical protein
MAHNFSRQVVTLECPSDLERPEAWGHFIQHPTFFTEAWRRCNYTDDDLQAIEIIVRLDTKTNRGIPGAGGIKTTRFFADEQKVICVWYISFEEAATIFLLAVNDGHMEEDFTSEELVALRRVAEEVEQEMRTPRSI